MGVVPPEFWAFVLASTLIELTPGPNMAWLAIVGATEGRRPAYAAVAGVALGLGLIGLAAALGVAAIVTTSPALYQTLRWGGVAYLFWLAWDSWRDGDGEAEDGVIGKDLTLYFRRGLITNLLNPKAAVFYIAVLPGFTSPALPALPQTLTLTAAYVTVATLIHASIATLAGLSRRILDDPHRSRIVRKALALALAGVALWFAWASAAPAAP